MSTGEEPDIKQTEHRLRSLTIRLEEETYKKLIAIAGEKSKAEYIRAVLVAHLSAPQEHRESTTPAPTNAPAEILKELELKDEIIRILEGRVKDLQSQNGFLIQDHTRISGQLDRLLMPSQEEIKVKRWFEFWK